MKSIENGIFSFFIRFLHLSSCIYWNFDDIFSIFSHYYITYKLYHTLFGYFIFYKINIYNNCQFGTSDKYFHLKSCFWCCVVLNLSEVINAQTGLALLQIHHHIFDVKLFRILIQ